MGSWIECSCGNRIHKNLFCGASVGVVAMDDDLDAIGEDWTSEKLLNYIVSKSDILVQCQICGRIAIESQESGEVAIYSPESSNE